MTWMTRFESGDHRAVWDEMTAAGAGLRTDSLRWSDAREVARATMTRVRENVEILVAGLSRAGYVFAAAEPPIIPPSSTIREDIDELESTIGVLPLSLRAFLESVGQVDLTGRHPDWAYELTDALVVAVPMDYARYCYEEWVEETLEVGETLEQEAPERFVLELAPDVFHKADYSGGAPYGMAVPDGSADGTFLNERHETTLIDYLRTAFEWGGFPGWAAHREDHPDSQVPDVIRELAARMRPF